MSDKGSMDRTRIEALLAAVEPSSTHEQLREALAAEWPGWQWLVHAADDEWWLGAEPVVRADGMLESPDRERWIKDQIAADGGDWRATWRRLKDRPFRTYRTAGTTVYAIAWAGSAPLDVWQIRIGVLTTADIGPAVPQRQPYGDYDLASTPVEGSTVVSGPRYELTGSVPILHLATWLERAARLEREERESKREEVEKRTIRQIDIDLGQPGRQRVRDVPFLSLNPGFFDRKPPVVRFYEDWQASSAGSEPVWRHYVLEAREWDEGGRRRFHAIPQPMVFPDEVRDAGLRPYQLMDALERMDESLGVRFGWFFQMLYGNRVDADVGRAVASAVEEGRIGLPDRDWLVLTRWLKDSYGF